MKKGIGIAVLALVLFAVLLVLGMHRPEIMNAQENDDQIVFLSIIRKQFSPTLKEFVKIEDRKVAFTAIVDPGDGRLFIATRDGQIRISSPDGTIQPELLLDIRDKVYDDGNEAGLVGLATHPDYSTNGLIFVFYIERIVENEEESLYSVVARYVVGTNGMAEAVSEERLLHFEVPTPRHHAGALQFGPKDGYLYIAVGDGGTAEDSAGNAQSTKSLLGKILRIDVNSEASYSIPPSNPYAADPESRGEIWAMGLRNPWQISFDRQTGDMYIGDVGEFTWEEVDFIPADSSGGENFGWPCMEGPDVLVPEVCDETVSYAGPIFFYLQDKCAAVINGYVYRGSQVPDLAGHYLVADLCRGNLWSLIRDNDGNWVERNYGHYGHNFTVFGERSDGELFIGASNTHKIFQFVGAD